MAAGLTDSSVADASAMERAASTWYRDDASALS
jgi:hypothetical protein